MVCPPKLYTQDNLSAPTERVNNACDRRDAIRGPSACLVPCRVFFFSHVSEPNLEIAPSMAKERTERRMRLLLRFFSSRELPRIHRTVARVKRTRRRKKKIQAWNVVGVIVYPRSGGPTDPNRDVGYSVGETTARIPLVRSPSASIVVSPALYVIRTARRTTAKVLAPFWGASSCVQDSSHRTIS